MDWLVNNTWARFQGTAQIAGVDGYAFRAGARDRDKQGNTDRFVLKIWSPGADRDSADPDYKASGDVRGGQVTIHTR